MYVITALFLFYAAVAGNFIDSLIGKGMHDLLQYRWMKHLMAFFILLFTISLVSAERDAWVTLLLSMGLYVWFLLTTKMDKWLNLAIVILLAIGFFLHRLLDTRYTVAWSQHANRDYRERVRCTLTHTVLAIMSCIIFITVVGNCGYVAKQLRDHRRDFSVVQYIFGGHTKS